MKKYHPEDRTRVDIRQDPDIEYWCRKFSVIMTREKLISLVERVGTDVKDIRNAWLKDLGVTDSSDRFKPIGEILEINEGEAAFRRFIQSQKDRRG